MEKQSLKHFALFSLLMSVLLSACLSRAQVEIRGKLPGKGAAFSSTQNARRQAKPEGSPSYTFTLINYPGTLSTYALGTNLGATTSKVEIVGGYGLASETAQGGFLAHVSGAKTVTETYEPLNDPHVPATQNAFGINDSGDIVGVYADTSGVLHGYERSGAKYTDLNVPFAGGTNTVPQGINNSGEIVGYYTDSDGLNQAFSLVEGTYTALEYPGAAQTLASGINSSGAIVGQYGDASGWHGFLLSGGTYTSFDFPGGVTETWPAGINDSGDIAGFYCLTEECIGDLSGAQGFLLSGETFTTIAVPGEFYTQALGINNKGQIVGIYQDAAGLNGSFMATP